MNFEVNIWDQLGDNPMIVCYTSVRLPFRVSGTSSTLRCNGGYWTWFCTCSGVGLGYHPGMSYGGQTRELYISHLHGHGDIRRRGEVLC